MDFDSFLELVSKKVKKKQLKRKSLSSKKRQEVLEEIVLDDECTPVPQSDDARGVYE